MITYQELGKWLQDHGIGSYFQGDDQLILSGQNPALPSSNCLWVQKKGNEWYIGTWLPAAYRVPTTQDIRYVCETVFRSSARAIYTIEQAITEPLNLRRLTDEEMDELGFS